MTNALKTLLIRAVSAVFFAFLFLGTFLFLPNAYFALLLGGVLLEILLVEWPRLCRQPRMWWGWWLTPVYPVAPMVILIGVSLSAQRLLLLALLVLAWIHDTCAYVVGSTFGRHKLWAAISPQKTWEGVFGGFLGTFLMLWFMRVVGFYAHSMIVLFVASAFMSVLFVLGDLFESWLKRMANIKDSGAIMPGHGGLLDRFDGVLFAAYVLVFLVLLVRCRLL